MRFTKDGRIDLSGITVADHEVEYAIAHSAAFYRDPEYVRRNIQIGKHCGAYDWQPAYEWWQREQQRKPLRIRQVPA